MNAENISPVIFGKEPPNLRVIRLSRELRQAVCSFKIGRGLLGAGALALSTMLVVLLGHAAPAQPTNRFLFGGCWVGKNSIGIHLFETATPLDPDNNRVALLATATADPTFGGVFPSATRMSNFHGEAVRSGQRTFHFNKIALGSDDNGQTLYFLESSGTKEFSDANSFHGTAVISIYLASQDADNNGFVDDGEKPVATIPYTFRLNRMSFGRP